MKFCVVVNNRKKDSQILGEKVVEMLAEAQHQAVIDDATWICTDGARYPVVKKVCRCGARP